MTSALEQRFLAKVEKHDPGCDCCKGCWHWTAALNHSGYGRFRHEGTTRLVHRFAYELYVGPIPGGMTIDHVCHDDSCEEGSECRHRRCVNPEHLVPATHRENIMRSNGHAAVNAAKTHCIHGHEFTPDNTSMNGEKRQCRQCLRDASTRYRRKTFGDPAGEWNIRKTHCKRGHPFDDENTYLMPGGGRQCRECKRQHGAASYLRRKLVAS